MVIGKLILKLGIESENLGALKAFENTAKTAEKAATGAAVKTTKLNVAKKSLSQSIKKITTDLSRYRIQVLGVTTALTAMSIYASKVALGLRQFEMNTGISAQKLQKWQQQMALSGISADETASSISGLQQAITEIKMGAGDVSPFAFLGVGVNRDPLVVLDQLKRRLAAFAPEVGTLMGTKMGLSPQFISALREANSIPESDKSLIMTDAELGRMKEFNIYFNRVWDNIKRAAQKLGALLSPIAREVLWLGDRFQKAFRTVAQFINGLIPSIGSFKIVIVALGVVLAAAFFPISTSITAILLALEDFATFWRGGNSMMGAIIGYFTDWKRPLQDIVILVASIVSGLTAAFNFIARLSGAKEIADLGESMMEGLANNTGMFNSYQDAQMAAMSNGKMITRGYDEKNPGPTVNKTVIINGVKEPQKAVDILKREFNQTTFQGSAPEG
jgi:hypothetical protein